VDGGSLEEADGAISFSEGRLKARDVAKLQQSSSTVDGRLEQDVRTDPTKMRYALSSARSTSPRRLRTRWHLLSASVGKIAVKWLQREEIDQVT
jgi:hypothetical protein